jgi:phosphatidylglycerophosphate synthase
MMKNPGTRLTVPNALSLSRVAGTPFLFILVHIEPKGWFVALFVLLALTDWLDGLLARRWNQTSEFGSMLDTIGDMALYMSTAYFMVVLFPQYLIPNLGYLYVLLAGFFAVMVVTRVLFGRVLFLHSHFARSAAVILIAAFLMSFYIDTTYLIRLVMVMYTTAFIEMCIIFMKYGEVDPDTRSILWLMEKRRQPVDHQIP